MGNSCADNKTDKESFNFFTMKEENIMQPVVYENFKNPFFS